MSTYKKSYKIKRMEGVNCCTFDICPCYPQSPSLRFPLIYSLSLLAPQSNLVCLYKLCISMFQLRERPSLSSIVSKRLEGNDAFQT